MQQVSFFTYDTNILTSEGYKTFNNTYHLITPKVMSADDEFQPGKFESYGYKHVIKILFDNSHFMECTPETTFRNVFGQDVKAYKMIGQIIEGFDNNHSKVTSIVDSGEIKEVVGFKFNDEKHEYAIIGGLVVRTILPQYL